MMAYFEFLLAKNIFGYNWSTLRDKELQVRWEGLKCWLEVIPVKHVLYNFRHSNAFPHISAVILYFYMKSITVFSRDNSTFTYCHNPCSLMSRSAPAVLRSGGSNYSVNRAEVRQLDLTLISNLHSDNSKRLWRFALPWNKNGLLCNITTHEANTQNNRHWKWMGIKGAIAKSAYLLDCPPFNAFILSFVLGESEWGRRAFHLDKSCVRAGTDRRKAANDTVPTRGESSYCPKASLITVSLWIIQMWAKINKHIYFSSWLLGY